MSDGTAQVTMAELLDDRIYYQWLMREPKTVSLHPNWAIYAQREEGGRWARRRFDSFSESQKFFRKNWAIWHDSALCCLNDTSRPPIIRDKNNPKKRRYYTPILSHIGHTWCTLCRRPTIFRAFSKHHALGKWTMPNQLRCSVCGLSEKTNKVYVPGRIR